MAERDLISKIKDFLKLSREGSHTPTHNRSAKGFFYGLSDLDPKHPVGKNNHIIHADLGEEIIVPHRTPIQGIKI